MTGTTYGIVVGYDGSPGAAQALRWAAREAWVRKTALTVCLAWTPDHMELPTESTLCDLARQHGQEVLTRGLPYAASGRVVVVRGAWRPANRVPGPVVLGADGSLAGLAATVFAFEEAELRDVPLVTVCALIDAPGRFGGSRQLEEDVDHLVAAEAKEYPEVSVVRQVLPGAPRAALLSAASDAQLLVVGARGRGGFDEMSLGSIAQAMLLYAPGSVAVVR